MKTYPFQDLRYLPKSTKAIFPFPSCCLTILFFIWPLLCFALRSIILFVILPMTALLFLLLILLLLLCLLLIIPLIWLLILLLHFCTFAQNSGLAPAPSPAPAPALTFLITLPCVEKDTAGPLQLVQLSAKSIFALYTTNPRIRTCSVL